MFLYNTYNIVEGVNVVKKVLLSIVILAAISLATACSAGKVNDTTAKTETTTQPLQVINSSTVTLVAKEEQQKLSNGVVVPVWTFNGSAPGPEIRVKKGETVKITLKNELSAPVSIHWHGYPVPNNMDGIPGVTQDAVAPGKSFTYEFVADKPGTYWYHSHQDSVNQLDRGLYGSLIVEDPAQTYDKDFTLMLDEWTTNKQIIDDQIKTMTGSAKNDTNNSGSMNNNNMGGMNHSGMNMGTTNSKSSGGMNMMGDNMLSMYDLFTINGKSGDLIKPLQVKQGDKVRVRLINAGYLSHYIHIHGHEIKVIATDGQPVNDPKVLKDQLLAIAPGERYDVEFVANNPGKWYIEDHSGSKQAEGMKALIEYEGSKDSTDKVNTNEQLPVLNIMNYGTKKEGSFTLNQKYDVTYSMDLNTVMNGNNMAYTINGKSFPNTDPIQVKKGDFVKVKLKNNSMMNDHPMHLHGHYFQLLSKNGKPIEGSPIMKDTINLKPGEEYEVAFVADNPGEWMFHCHDLHHAAAGMVTELKYTDFQSSFKPDPTIGNMPE